jgi:hypothetical protein
MLKVPKLALLQSDSTTLLHTSQWGPYQKCKHTTVLIHFSRPTIASATTRLQCYSYTSQTPFLLLFYNDYLLSLFSFASTCTYPVQVIKTRLQQRSQAVEISQDTGKIQVIRREYTGGIFDCVQRIWTREGIGGFFKGCIPNAIRVAPNAAITFVTYETVMDMIVGYENRR